MEEHSIFTVLGVEGIGGGSELLALWGHGGNRVRAQCCTKKCPSNKWERAIFVATPAICIVRCTEIGGHSPSSHFLLSDDGFVVLHCLDGLCSRCGVSNRTTANKLIGLGGSFAEV